MAELEVKKVVDAKKALAETNAAKRVTAVKAEIEEAKVSREKLEASEGLVESPAVKAEREAAEKVKLAEAAQVRTIELVEGSGGSALTNILIERLNEVITHINGK